MTSTNVDPWLAGRARLAETRSTAQVAKINAKADADERRAGREERRAGKRQERRDTRRARRGRAVKAAWAAVEAHGPELPWLAVMGTPMLLAWTSMAGYGIQVYGRIGVLLPLFSEAATLVFALAIPRAVRAGQPVRLLRLGLVVFAVVQAVLNYTHGASDVTTVVDGHPVTTPGNVDFGVVMALVSLGGVTVHQVVRGRPPRPLRSRQERQAARRGRAVARRVHRLQVAAARSATPVLAADGSVTLVYRPGPLSERRFPRHRVAPTTVAGLPVVAVPSVAEEAAAWLATTPAPAGNSGNTVGKPGNSGNTAPPGNSGNTIEAGLVARARAAIQAGELPENPSRRAVQKLLKVRAEIAQAIKAALEGGNSGNEDGNSGNPVGVA